MAKRKTKSAATSRSITRSTARGKTAKRRTEPAASTARKRRRKALPERRAAPLDPALRPHVVSLGNNGRLKADGPFGMTPAGVERLVHEDIPRITAGWGKRRIMLYAHGGVVSADQALAHAQSQFRQFLEAEVYPLFFIWRTDPITQFLFEIEDQLDQVRPKILGLELEDVENLLDDIAEGIAKKVVFKDQWRETKENAILATAGKSGGARMLAVHLAALMRGDPSVELHLVGHSAGSVFHAPLVQFLTASASGKIKSGPMKGQMGLNVPVASCHLWAPGCTFELFSQTYVPALRSRALNRLTLYTLSDKIERADKVGAFYRKSILYLVSNALEDPARVPPALDGKPLVGLAKCVERDIEFSALLQSRLVEWITATEKDPPEKKALSAARTHAAFDEEPITLRTTLARIRGEA